MTKVLLIQLRQLGDILLTTPCAHAIKQEQPDTYVSFLCHKMGRPLLSSSPDLDELLLYDEKAGWRATWELVQTIRRQRFDLVIDFMNNPRSALFCLLSGARRRVAFTSARRLAYTQTCEPPQGIDYIVREKFLLLRAVGYHPHDETLRLPPDPSPQRLLTAFAAAEPRFAQAPLRVVLSPTHRREHRKWPLAHYCALADRLCQQWGASVTWIWGPGEEAEVDQAIGLCQQPTLKAPATSLRELASFMAGHDLFIGNSNGPSHLAVASGVCTLQLHGHTAARAWSPCTDHHRAIQSPEYGQNAQPQMAAISLERVWEELAAFAPYLRQEAAKKRAGEASV